MPRLNVCTPLRVKFFLAPSSLRWDNVVPVNAVYTRLRKGESYDANA